MRNFQARGVLIYSSLSEPWQSAELTKANRKDLFFPLLKFGNNIISNLYSKQILNLLFSWIGYNCYLKHRIIQLKVHEFTFGRQRCLKNSKHEQGEFCLNFNRFFPTHRIVKSPKKRKLENSQFHIFLYAKNKEHLFFSIRRQNM